jgi:hypothetical protein
MFADPVTVFPEEMLRPEIQDPAIFADGMDNICSTHHRVADLYFQDGSIEGACPPLRALLHIMRDGQWEGHTLASPEVRDLFSRQVLLESEWYQRRLECCQQVEIHLWDEHVRHLDDFLHLRAHEGEATRLGISEKMDLAKKTLETVRHQEYPQTLRGTLGTDPYFYAK